MIETRNPCPSLHLDGTGVAEDVFAGAQPPLRFLVCRSRSAAAAQSYNTTAGADLDHGESTAPSYAGGSSAATSSSTPNNEKGMSLGIASKPAARDDGAASAYSLDASGSSSTTQTESLHHHTCAGTSASMSYQANNDETMPVLVGVANPLRVWRRRTDQRRWNTECCSGRAEGERYIAAMHEPVFRTSTVAPPSAGIAATQSPSPSRSGSTSNSTPQTLLLLCLSALGHFRP
ncbi:hypothetical protein HMN09_00662600 [Mycena chlorophos]|uniref:Uncharacterized protein n=1 Tax=Mycena chlorophos TaxID=658473 RepID=A0A8H6SZE9_MYCCL|nr:hypothetical protein HMN09_00662600 [Mycena chlorophos]